MVFQKGSAPQQPRPKKENDGCVVDIKKTKSGKRISFKGKCSREQLKMMSAETGADLDAD